MLLAWQRSVPQQSATEQRTSVTEVETPSLNQDDVAFVSLRQQSYFRIYASSVRYVHDMTVVYGAQSHASPPRQHQRGGRTSQ